MNSPYVNTNLPPRRNKKNVCSKETTAIQDEKVPIDSDLCDCLEKDCIGCFYPCESCKSTKCGSQCRIRRPWKFERVILQGVIDPESNLPNV